MVGYPSATAFKRSAFWGYKDEYVMREDWEIFLRSYLEGLSLKILDEDKVFIREHPRRTSKSKNFGWLPIRFMRTTKTKCPRNTFLTFSFMWEKLP